MGAGKFISFFSTCSALVASQGACIQTVDLGTLPPDSSSLDVPSFFAPDTGENPSDGGRACSSNTDCPYDGSFCKKPDFGCSVAGLCGARPVTCSPTAAPVCDCSNTTRDNTCEAELAGENVSRPGACQPPPLAEAGSPLDGAPSTDQ
jgi:hypothetical protein